MNETLVIIKPEAVESNKIGAILKIIEENDFKIVNLKKLKISKEQAEKFYDVHQSRSFFKNLVEYMTSGPVVVAEIRKADAVVSLRSLIGATDPAEANEKTIRKLYGTNKEKNAVHGSDSNENAKKEINFFFG